LIVWVSFPTTKKSIKAFDHLIGKLIVEMSFLVADQFTHSKKEFNRQVCRPLQYHDNIMNPTFLNKKLASAFQQLFLEKRKMLLCKRVSGAKVVWPYMV
jgi:hypothetical protein